MEPLDIKAAFINLFPLSHITMRRGALGGKTIFITCYLQQPDEWSNKISHNDPLNYMAEYDPETGTYKEHHNSLTVKPDNKYMAYGSAKMRKTTIKNVSIEKVRNRFLKLKGHIQNNLVNAAHDIANKV